ncbi:MAG: hypothetical protein HY594_02065 [Candidatus Omnitrophica bacterium]|nr:hypothetical protein [Candidatus Omnitrophota bacterium]
MKTTVVGSYPKVTEDNAENLPGVIDRWQKQQLTDADLEAALVKTTTRVIQEQEKAGIDLITDGQIRWQDLTHPIGEGLKNVKLGGLRRFFDNNVYYRRPLIHGTPAWEKPILADWFKQAREIAQKITQKTTEKPLKVSLPGPLTFTVLAEDLRNGRSKPESLLKEMTVAIRKEVEALAAAGATHIQLEEPALEPNQPLLDAGIAAINEVFSGIKATRWVTLYFFDVTSILPRIAKIQADVLGLDLVTAPQLAAKVGSLPQQLALGVIDARNTRAETTDQIRSLVEPVASKRPADSVWLSPNCGLEFLPQGRALKKLDILVQAARILAPAR